MGLHAGVGCKLTTQTPLETRVIIGMTSHKNKRWRKPITDEVRVLYSSSTGFSQGTNSSSAGSLVSGGWPVFLHHVVVFSSCQLSCKFDTVPVF
ncbi:hypothetical protein SADUNF_Sadunf02G0087400 [Salix dunnii]|uniref:Uncharacterized protein n=1 Tax=Salix dunnii TaxID=1413687 RepID=A0A835N730_9ROSI|nr:hypothetical protein SADUNF_Sadunf02G0087400 [Salix dunnii]